MTTQLLTFHLADAVYGIDILHVREIRAVGPLAVLPGSPSFVRGVMNLRGSVVPVIDLRARLGMDRIEPGKFAVIVVADIEGKSVGLLADSVNEVAPIDPSALKPPPGVAVLGDQRFIQSLALRTREDGQTSMIVVLNLERIHDAELMPGAETLAAAVETAYTKETEPAAA